MKQILEAFPVYHWVGVIESRIFEIGICCYIEDIEFITYEQNQSR